MHQREQRLREAAELVSAGVAGPAVLAQQPGHMLDKLMSDIERGLIYGTNRSPSAASVLSSHHADDEGPCFVTTPADQTISPSSTELKGSSYESPVVRTLREAHRKNTRECKKMIDTAKYRGSRGIQPCDLRKTQLIPLMHLSIRRALRARNTIMIGVC